MSNWIEIKDRYGELAAECCKNGAIGAAWDRFCESVEASRHDPPYHLRLLLDLLDEVRGERRRAEIRILDHGCGGALSLLYLLAHGYESIHGVDVGGPCEAFNRLLNGHLGLQEQRFFVYDGRRLPFTDDSLDFAFSTQVLEHVRSDVLESFYAEEGRVLTAGGVAYHQVPHRLVPYDSHTDTWLIHYLPRPLWLAILRRIRPDATMPENALFLRWPWVHRRLAGLHIGPTEDRTMQRFMGLNDLSAYDGPKGLRRGLGHFLAIPCIGWAGRRALTNFVMLDSVSHACFVPAIRADRAVAAPQLAQSRR